VQEGAEICGIIVVAGRERHVDCSLHIHLVVAAATLLLLLLIPLMNPWVTIISGIVPFTCYPPFIQVRVMKLHKNGYRVFAPHMPGKILQDEDEGGQNNPNSSKAETELCEKFEENDCLNLAKSRLKLTAQPGVKKGCKAVDVGFVVHSLYIRCTFVVHSLYIRCKSSFLFFPILKTLPN
jgi:hypothetical protein